jgi:hypothetical protein
MHAILNDIAVSLFSKGFEECSIGDIKEFSQKHPYSLAGHLLLSQKLKDNKENHKEQWQKALLYFNNPLLANYFFNRKAQKVLVPDGKKIPIIKEQVDDTEHHLASPIKNAVNLSLLQEDEVLSSDEDQMPDGNSESANEDAFSIPPLKIEPISTETSALIFTPYYTVDYFASQGIKLNEVAATDRFGKQLKSFTEWLKEMRRLPDAPKSSLQTKEEITIEKMAENSIVGENAYTEAMADVWIKQGEWQKAIEVYQKLSLIIPAKSAYFAAKIEHLKKSL